MAEVEIYTDGACSGNPGPGVGGRCCWLRGSVRCHRAEPQTTNQRMELTAAIGALFGLETPMSSPPTDSAYLIMPLNSGGLTAGSRTAGGTVKDKPWRTRTCGRNCCAWRPYTGLNGLRSRGMRIMWRITGAMPWPAKQLRI